MTLEEILEELKQLTETMPDWDKIKRLSAEVVERLKSSNLYYESTRNDIQQYVNRIFRLEEELAWCRHQWEQTERIADSGQSVIDRICDELLGHSYSISVPVDTVYANEIMCADILREIRRLKQDD